MPSDYNTCEPLRGEFSHHRVGVLECGTHEMQGRRIFEIEASGVALWHSPFVLMEPAEDRDAALAKATSKVIDSLDAAIAERQSHRDRMAAELTNLCFSMTSKGAA
jgi:hypothetical protein